MTIFSVRTPYFEFEYDSDAFKWNHAKERLEFNKEYKGDVVLPSGCPNFDELFIDCDLTGVNLLECDTTACISAKSMFKNCIFPPVFQFPKGFVLKACKNCTSFFENAQGAIKLNADFKIHPFAIDVNMFSDAEFVPEGIDPKEVDDIIEVLKGKEQPKPVIKEEAPKVEAPKQYDFSKVYDLGEEKLKRYKGNLERLLEDCEVKQ